MAPYLRVGFALLLASTLGSGTVWAQAVDSDESPAAEVEPPAEEAAVAEAEAETDASDEAVKEPQVVAETANGVVEGEAEEAQEEKKEG